MYYEEVWVSLDGLSNYSVSSYGRVINVHTGVELKPSKTRNGLLRVNLSRNGVKKTVYLHRLVAKCFFLKYKDRVKIEFINGDKNDCSVLNLRMVLKEKEANGD